jgi:hypothetical protein
MATTYGPNGITYAAAQPSETGANVLDDYEEGTWTPALGRTGSNYSYSTQNGVYTKVGRIVAVRFHVYVSSVTTQGSRMVKISGGPFSSGTVGNYGGGGTVGNQGAISGEPCTSVGTSSSGSYYFSATGNPLVNEGLLGENNAASVTIIAGGCQGALVYYV